MRNSVLLILVVFGSTCGLSAQMSFTGRFASQSDSLEWEKLLVASYRFPADRPDSSYPLVTQAYDIARRSIRGGDHPSLAFSAIALGSNHYGRGDLMAAAPLFETGVAMLRRVLNGADHPIVATNLGNLASIYHQLGRFPQAEPLYSETLAMCRRMYGKKDHPLLARSLDNMALLNSDLGRIAEAVPLQLEALEMRQRLFVDQDHGDLAKSMNNMALLYHRQGNQAQAEPLFVEALAMRRRLFRGADHPELATSIENLAGLYTEQGRFGVAEPLVVEALAMQRRMHHRGDHRDLAHAIHSNAALFHRAGRHTDAEPLYTESVAMLKRLSGGQDRPELAQVLADMAIFLESRAFYSRAELLHAEALSMRRRIFSGSDHPALATSIASMATFHVRRSRYADAQVLYIEALAMQQRLHPQSDHTDLASLLTTIGAFHYERGDVAQAEAYYDQAIAMYRRLYTDANHAGMATALGNAALFEEQRGRLAEAERLYRESLAILRRVFKGTDHPDLARSIDNMALFLDRRNQQKEAGYLFEEGVAMKRRIYDGVDHPDLALSLNNFALHLEAEGRYTEAERVLNEALAISRRVFSTDHRELALTINNLAVFLFNRKRTVESEPLMREALAMRRRLYAATGHPDLAASLIAMASLHIRQKRTDSALVLYSDVRLLLVSLWETSAMFESEAELMRSRDVSAHYIDIILSELWRERNGSRNAGEDFLLTGYLTKSGILEQMVAKRTLLSRQMAGDTMLQRLWSSYRTSREQQSRLISNVPGDSIGISNWRAEIERLGGVYNAAEKELARRVSMSAESTSHVDWNDVRSVLKQGEAAIEFVSFRYHTGVEWTDSIYHVAVVLRPGTSMPVIVPLCEERELKRVIDYPVDSKGSYVTRGVNAVGTAVPHEKASDRGAELYDLIWRPVDSLLGAGDRVYVSPSGTLTKVSFAALPLGADSLLSDRYRIHYLLSTRNLATSRAALAIGNRTAAIFGGARFDNTVPLRGGNMARPGRSPAEDRGNSSRWNYLEGTEREAKQIRSIFNAAGWRTTLDTGISASEESLKAVDANGSPGVLHIATHGFFLADPRREGRPGIGTGGPGVYSDPMLRSGIILSGANHVWSGRPPIDGVQDGIVTAYEVAGLDLSNTELVVLSACETGLGDISNGEGVFGLQRAFSIAGAKSIVMSLWKVPDAQTAELMNTFYTNWLIRRMERYDAFIDAQKQMRAKYPPYYWAAFVMMGE
jgi:CHAT domain-containing protein/tetratricopeptide (TPR) repeat protein